MQKKFSGATMMQSLVYNIVYSVTQIDINITNIHINNKLSIITSRVSPIPHKYEIAYV